VSEYKASKERKYRSWLKKHPELKAMPPPPPPPLLVPVGPPPPMHTHAEAVDLLIVRQNELIQAYDRILHLKSENYRLTQQIHSAGIAAKSSSMLFPESL
jgi:hypothetical protein